MFALLSGAYEQWIRRPEYNVLILGLDGAGKTYVQIFISLHTVASLSIRNVTIKVWDLGGSEELHRIWENYYLESDAVIFVIDGNDRERMERMKSCFGNVTKHDELDGVPILILINKQDLLGDDELALNFKEYFNPMIADIGAREAKVLSCSALKG